MTRLRRAQCRANFSGCCVAQDFPRNVSLSRDSRDVSLGLSRTAVTVHPPWAAVRVSGGFESAPPVAERPWPRAGLQDGLLRKIDFVWAEEHRRPWNGSKLSFTHHGVLLGSCNPHPRRDAMSNMEPSRCSWIHSKPHVACVHTRIQSG